MKNLRMHDLLRREAVAMLRLGPWILVSLVLALGLLGTDLVATSGLFQSPPTSTPPPEVTSTPEVPEPTATEAQTPTIQPTQTAVPTATMTEIPPTDTPTALPPTLTFTPPPTETTVAPTATVDERQRYPDDGTELIFDLGTLFDSVALGVSYLWLCCGVIVFLMIPILFIILWLASRRRSQQHQE